MEPCADPRSCGEAALSGYSSTLRLLASHLALALNRRKWQQPVWGPPRDTSRGAEPFAAKLSKSEAIFPSQKRRAIVMNTIRSKLEGTRFVRLVFPGPVSAMHIRHGVPGVMAGGYTTHYRLHIIPSTLRVRGCQPSGSDPDVDHQSRRVGLLHLEDPVWCTPQSHSARTAWFAW